MNILFLTISKMEDLNQRGIYTDLVRELDSKGVNVYIASPSQRRESLGTELVKEGRISILKIKTGNITQTKNLIEKGISTISIESQYLKAIRKYFGDVKFDMVMYSTPPITFNKILKYYKEKYNSKTYLILKDIFPQNAVDIGLMRQQSLLRKYFRNKEMNLYNNSDVIGCMSKGNLEYILKHNKFINESKIEVFPNAIKPIPRKKEQKKNKELLKKYSIPECAVLFTYGGNLGAPQGIDFLLEVADNFHKVENSFLLIVGNGTEYGRIKNHIENRNLENVSLFERLPKEEYDQLIDSSDVGLIFLDKRFTIPNFPSRLTSYMENSLPILAATDVNTDLKDTLKESKSGLWCESGDINSFIKYAQRLSNSKKLREEMGLNGRVYLEENFDITDTISILLKHLDGVDKHVQE